MALAIPSVTMAKAAIVILAGTESHENLGRMFNALETAREFVETEGDEVKVVFDGAGTEWIPELADPEGDYAELYGIIEDHVEVCEYCAGAFEVADEVEAAGVPTADEHNGHPSIRGLVEDGYEVITF
jgi:hypothetical protein